MISISARLRHSCFCAVLLIGAAQADPNQFTFSTIAFPGANNTTAYGVNNLGQIVGMENANATLNGFVSTESVFTTFNATPGSMAGSYAEGINNLGQIVGLNVANRSGFLLSGTTFTNITVPGSDSGTTNATGINDSGQIVGTFLMGGVQYGFLLSGGVYTTIAAPGATTTVASGINDSGQIVGWYAGAGGVVGFSLSGGTFTPISFPGALSTLALGINNEGQIVGQYTSGGVLSGFLFEGGNYTTISVPGSTLTIAEGINDDGQIVGSYLSSGTTFGFSAAQNTESVSFNTFPLASGAGSITAGPDGAMWFLGGPVIGRITTGGVITDYPVQTTSTYEIGIAAGPDGALWFTEPDSDAILRITTSGVVSEYPLPANTVPTGGIAAGPDGALWFTEITPGDRGGVANSGIGTITTLGVITEYPLPNPGSDPSAIVAGPDGALWFTEAIGSAIGRITTSGLSITEYPLPTPITPQPGAITVGSDGALWFTETGAGNIGRITTSGTISEYPSPAPNAQLEDIAAGPDGALWFTDSRNALIGRITTSGIFTEYPVPAAGGQPSSIAAGPDGNVWFTAMNGIGQVVLIANPALPPALNITKTHSGSFTQSQTNATYTVMVSNQAGAAVSSGPVIVTDTLPSGLTLVSMTGTGWSCVSNSCTRSDPLPGGAIYPTITATVNVAFGASSPQVNSVSVSGGGSASAGASDSTTITPNPPLLSITKTHAGNFAQGQLNALYTATVTNRGGPTNGIVTVTEIPPAGETLVSMAGTGWSCSGVTCTRSDVLSSYPAITVTVNVAANASSPQVNQVSVSGGGSASTSTIADSTVIVPAGQGTLTVTPNGGSPTFTYVLGNFGPTPFDITLALASNPTGAGFTVTSSANLTPNVTSGTTPNSLTISVNTAAVTTPGTQSGTITVSVLNSELGCASPVMVAGQSLCTAAVPFTINVQPIFFEGAATYWGQQLLQSTLLRNVRLRLLQSVDHLPPYSGLRGHLPSHRLQSWNLLLRRCKWAHLVYQPVAISVPLRFHRERVAVLLWRKCDEGWALLLQLRRRIRRGGIHHTRVHLPVGLIESSESASMSQLGAGIVQLVHRSNDDFHPSPITQSLFLQVCSRRSYRGSSGRIHLQHHQFHRRQHGRLRCQQ